MIEELVARVFALRDAAHLAHWAAKGDGSYARHMALGEFYEALPGLIDEIVETYQGGFTLIGNVDPVSFPKADVIDLISSEGKWIAANRDKIARGSCALENLIDGLVGQYMRSYYKLTKLR